MATQAVNQIDQQWQDVAASSDEGAFRELVKPHLNRLLEAARYDLDYYVAQGTLQIDDFTPEEVVGEGLIRTWEDRAHKPDGMSVRGWLLGNLYRTLRTMVEQEHEYDEDKAISLDEEVVLADSENQAVEEQFWDWYQPDVNLVYEDIIPATQPVDFEVPLYATRESFALPPDPRHVVIMHDEFEMDLPEVAAVLGRNLNEIASLLQEARATLYERIGGERGIEEVDHPAPPDGSDE
jgi:DNA-directed RNA polymerase specialized sigma24 family protein